MERKRGRCGVCGLAVCFSVYGFVAEAALHDASQMVVKFSVLVEQA